MGTWLWWYFCHLTFNHGFVDLWDSVHACTNGNPWSVIVAKQHNTHLGVGAVTFKMVARFVFRRVAFTTQKVLDGLLRIIVFCYNNITIVIFVVFIFSNVQTIYFSTKVFLALQVWSKRKLLKKWQMNSFKLENCQPSTVSVLYYNFTYILEITKKTKQKNKAISMMLGKSPRSDVEM